MIDTWDATWDAYPIIDAPTTTDMGGEMPDIDRYMSGECWWDENSYSYEIVFIDDGSKDDSSLALVGITAICDTSIICQSIK